MDETKTMTAFVVQDCVERDDIGEYGFRCDAQVSLSLTGAKKAAWLKFGEHYARLAGHPPSDEIRREFGDAMSRADGSRCYTIDTTEHTEVTVEILERRTV